MDKTKIEQIKDKICDYMLAVDLGQLSMYDLNSYISAYKSLEGGFSFPGFGLGLGNAPCAATDKTLDTSKGE